MTTNTARLLTIGLFLLAGAFLQGVEYFVLEKALLQQQSPFDYPLDIKTMEGVSHDEEVILMAHGYGSNSGIIHKIGSQSLVPDHLVSFNFPDFSINHSSDRSLVKYGTIEELLPALYVLKLVVVGGGADTVSLYGFSAGGGAVTNMIGVLNTSDYDADLQTIGISPLDKNAMLNAVQNGVVLLDVPLKSMEEVVDHRSDIPNDDPMVRNYKENNLQPIDSLCKWKGLDLSVVVFFQSPDEVLGNRDDALFACRLRQYNASGSNRVLSANEGGHSRLHLSLWNAYLNMRRNVIQRPSGL